MSYKASEVFTACRVLFGGDIQINSAFLRTLDADALRRVYRTRAKETHPDILTRTGMTPAAAKERFLRVQAAYELVAEYLNQPTAEQETPKPAPQAKPEPAKTETAEEPKRENIFKKAWQWASKEKPADTAQEQQKQSAGAERTASAGTHSQTTRQNPQQEQRSPHAASDQQKQSAQNATRTEHESAFNGGYDAYKAQKAAERAKREAEEAVRTVNAYRNAKAATQQHPRDPFSTWASAQTAGHTFGAKDFTTTTFRQFDRSQYLRLAAKLPRRPLYFGEFLYHAGVISWQDLIKAIVWQRSGRARVGDIGKRWGWFTEDIVMDAIVGRNHGEFLGQAMVRLDIINTFNLRTLLHQQMKEQRPLGEFFITNSMVNRQDMPDLLSFQKHHNGLYLKQNG